MAKQNPEVVLEALRQTKKIHLEISKASDSLWQVSLALDEKESQLPDMAAVDSSSPLVELNDETLQNHSVNTQDVNSAKELSSAPDSPVQPSNLNPKESQSNPTDLPTLNQPVQSSSSDARTSQFNTINSKKKNVLTQSQSSRFKKTSKRDSRKVYDVFLSHNTEDRKLVEDIGDRLKQKWGLHCWFDEWCLGEDNVFDEIEKQAQTVKSIAIFVSKHGIGKFQKKEIEVFLVAKDRRGSQNPLKIIPVILRDCDTSQVPLFITAYKWVDFNEKEYLESVEDLFFRIKGVSRFKPPNSKNLSDAEEINKRCLVNYQHY